MENPAVIVAVGLLITLGLALAARSLLRRFRRIVNLPTSACRGIAPGLTELKGNVDRLRRLGVAAVEGAGADTCADRERFFSYRRATHRQEHDYGRQLSAIALIG